MWIGVGVGDVPGHARLVGWDRMGENSGLQKVVGPGQLLLHLLPKQMDRTACDKMQGNGVEKLQERYFRIHFAFTTFMAFFTIMVRVRVTGWLFT